MEFNSAGFLLFFPAVYLAYYLAPQRYRWALLLAGSYLFYLSLLKPFLVLVLGAVTMAAYLSAMAMEKARDDGGKKRIFWAGAGFCILTLAVLKYSAFAASNLNGLLRLGHAGLQIPAIPLLPSIGVSYYTFQAISYLADVYLGRQKPEPHPGYFALYMGFFPKLLMGPIERGGDLLPQLKAPFSFNYDNARSGAFLFALGLFKKVVVADRLGIYVNAVFGGVREYGGVVFIFTLFLYSLQIYYDFSGYTDMALGTARLFNVRLTQNFDRPYFALSIADFWRRWHISLSRWLMDYLFMPLQVKFRSLGAICTPLSLVIVFLTCGLWHGAGWTFIAWGAIHGVYMVASTLTRNLRKKLETAVGLSRIPAVERLLKGMGTFALVAFAWIFFRAESPGDALYVAGHVFAPGAFSPEMVIKPISGVMHFFEFFQAAMISIIVIELALSVARLKKLDGIESLVLGLPAPARWLIYLALVNGIIMLGSAGVSYKFIYLQF
jgi:D-alanyl-lipoteichoic acid acyltransferase DltB (MBOAT superfamily)